MKEEIAKLVAQMEIYFEYIDYMLTDLKSKFETIKEAVGLDKFEKECYNE